MALPHFILSDARLPLTEEPRPGSDAAAGLTSFGPRGPLRSIPEQIADFLLENYIARATSSYPIFYEPWLRSAYASVFQDAPNISRGNGSNINEPKVYDTFVICLVMAVSLSSTASTKQAQANSMASKLCKQAISHIKQVLTDDFAGIQALVLLHTYAIMNPAVANVYFLAGYIMQACMDQGLHRETSIADSIDRTDLLVQDMRRRVFWTAWELDASCSAGFARPVALRPEDISTVFPSDF
ncbi:hypothetical protein NW762_008947 [Fusarium torreyae]|uniref:Xylanolytic transcriptional activator regulatory domain-containing protein n=1 Tax=Fusarium torreyae TaxID=1237075 RepID=A0A9W8RWA5_9HYPO|nr:hypothetical protein NW762_008947 [Fusarium torreyae]